ncbi:hypothetical protein RJT08_05995 [Bacteroides caccae]|uniref:hypothetical protein n=1 Tax=Bacteroides caccae TaxID=47678 RepID=UPI00234D2D3C|nr:hypothetical protein [Bacteroides caccae]WOG12636.1 hypothetical protein RJT08_05995 [Bacteroides caccae]
MERIIRNHLEPTKELYALALQTGEVTLPLGGKYPHVTYPAPGGTETPISNVWIVNGNYMGKTYECHGCDSCMKCYQDAGLITYNIVRRDSTSVRSIVCLTEKGKQYLIERHISGFHPIINAWRRREQLEVVLVAKEKFDLEIHPSDTTEIYHCKVHRKLEITPFIGALGATGKENQPDYVRKLRVDLNNKEYPMVTYIEMEP